MNCKAFCLFGVLNLIFCIEAIGQSAPPGTVSGSLNCNSGVNGPPAPPVPTGHPGFKWLSFSGSWPASAVPSGKQVVGVYKPVYRSSPATFYSPAAPTQPASNVVPPQPSSSNGTEGAWIAKKSPSTQTGMPLQGVHVYFEYGTWVHTPWPSVQTSLGVWTVPGWHWHGEGVLCNSVYIPNNTSTCFSAGTHVLTNTGSVPIEQIEVGDEILTSSRDNHTNGLRPSVRKVTHVESGSDQLLHLVVDGQSIKTTEQHLVLTKSRGWTPMNCLKPGDKLRSHNSRWVEVESISTGIDAPVYNLVVDGNSSFFVGDDDWGFSIQVLDGCGAKSSEPYDFVAVEQSIIKLLGHANDDLSVIRASLK